MELNTELRNRKRRAKRFTTGLLLLLVFLIAVECLHSKYGLMQTRYEVSCGKLTDPIRIVQLTDLHGSVFGENNSRLIRMVSDAKPDLILITGDLVNSHGGSYEGDETELIRSLSAITPVYISLGNQEMDLSDRQGIDYVDLYEEAGATVLERSYVDIKVKGQAVRIGGIYGYCLPFAFSKEAKREDEAEFLIDYQDTDALKLLLCHMPVSWVDSYSLYDYDPDVVFAGHSHGGQVRIPFVGGLWAPDQGWFPGDLCGVYTTSEQGWKASREEILKYARSMKYDDSYTDYYREHDQYKASYLVLSRGLGNTDLIPRFLNVPEVVVVCLSDQES